MTTRANIESSWRAAKRSAEHSGAVIANAASAAGQYLEIASGDPRRAIAMLPKDGGRFWTTVAAHLGLVEAEERRQGPRLTGT
jgi:hypothetical protein